MFLIGSNRLSVTRVLGRMLAYTSVFFFGEAFFTLLTLVDIEYRLILVFNGFKGFCE